MQAHSLANGTKKQTNWNAIHWRKANRTVRNLRHRIFRAAQEGTLNKVRSLQKLMLKSYSNRLVSVRRAAQINAGKHTPGVDKLVIKTPAEEWSIFSPTIPSGKPNRCDESPFQKLTTSEGRSESPSWWIAAFRHWSKMRLNQPGRRSSRAQATASVQAEAAMM